MLAACLGDANIDKTQLAIGFIQFLTAIYLLGWFISIYWGILILRKSKGDHNEIKNLLNSAQGNSSDMSPAGTAGQTIGGSSGANQAGRKRKNNPYEDI